MTHLVRLQASDDGEADVNDAYKEVRTLMQK